MIDLEEVKMRESPARRFAQKWHLTSRRTAVLLMIQEMLDRHEFMFRTLMSFDTRLLRISLGQAGGSEEEEQQKPIRIGNAGLLACPEVFMPEWQYTLEEACELTRFTRFLIVTGTSELPFYLHATLDNFNDVVWDWRDIDALRDHIYMPSLMVLKHTITMLLQHELPEISKAALRLNRPPGINLSAWYEVSDGPQKFGQGTDDLWKQLSETRTRRRMT